MWTDVAPYRSITHTNGASLKGETRVTLPLEFTFSYPQELMNLARQLIMKQRFSLAVIVVHKACEIATERTISETVDAKGEQHLKRRAKKLPLGYNNLAREKVRSLYTELTGGNLPQDIWIAFKTSADLRNAIVHRGRIANDAEAEASYKACNDVLEHLLGRMRQTQSY